jgi:hypothetical protein
MADNSIQKKVGPGTSMGVTSIIAILVILVLSVFAALSMTTSKADLALSDKTAESNTSYYDADNAAEEQVAVVDSIVKSEDSVEEKLASEGFSVEAADNGILVSYQIPMNETQELSVVLLAKPNGEIERKDWHIIRVSDWAPENKLNLIQ